MDNKIKYALMASFAKLTKQALVQVYQNVGRIDIFNSNVDDGYDTEGYTLETDDTLYIVFRGTEVHCIKDIFTDINAFSIPYENSDTNIRVHRGVYRAYLSVRYKLYHALYIAMNKKCGKKIVVIGHSLGGGLAPLCAVDIQYNWFKNSNWKDIECYIYGALKVFNKEGVESYNKRVPKTFNYQNTKDIVTKMPPLLPYHHVGEIIKVKARTILQNHNIDYGYIANFTEDK